MSSRLEEIFIDNEMIRKIQNKLPYLFQIAEIENSKASKVGMEVGLIRERIIIALLIYKFGEENVETNIGITEPEVDVKLFNKPISIKTITKKLSGVKLIWTVDYKKVQDFKQNYQPKCDILLIQINWGNDGGLYYIPLESQQEIIKKLGKDGYIKLPKEGTNPRGVEITGKALKMLIKHELSKKIEIKWEKISNIDYDPYKRWVEYWGKD